MKHAHTHIYKYTIALIAAMLTACVAKQSEDEFDRLLSRADSIYHNSPEEALELQREAANVADTEEERWRASLEQAQTYYYMGDTAQTETLIQECVQYYDSAAKYNINLLPQQLSALNIYADFLRTGNRSAESIGLYQRAADVARMLDRTEDYINNLLYVYKYEEAIGSYTTAIDGYNELYAICEKSGLTAHRINILNSLIQVNLTLGDTERAVDLLAEVRSSIPADNEVLMAMTKLSELRIALYANDTEQQKIHVEALRQICEDNGLAYEYYSQDINILLAEYYLKKRTNDSASIYIYRLVDEFDHSEDLEKQDYTRLLLAHYYLNIGRNEKALHTLQEIDSELIYSDIALYERYLELLSRAYYKLNNYKDSYFFFNQRVVVSEMLQRENVAHNYAFKHLDFRRDTTILAQHFHIKEQEAALKSAQLWRRIWIIIITITLTVSLIAFFHIKIIFMRRRVKDIATQNEQLQREVVRQTTILKKQELELRHKKNEMTSQIVYASQIQHYILPDIATFNSPYIKDAFILFKPCQVVSGDFYWCKEKDGKQIIVCADATGHGIPGAFVAMVCATVLNNVEHIAEINTTAALLETLDENIRSILHSNDSSTGNDSVDISILCIDNETGKITFGSARHSSYLIKKNGETIRVSGTRRSLGDTQPAFAAREFTETRLDVEDGDMIFLTTDGYESQLGGQHGKKLKRDRMAELFVQVSQESSDVQKRVLEQENAKWKGDNEQTDDILVIGIRFRMKKTNP